MIEIICGPMFSGKTEELIRRLKRVKIAQTEYIVIKPKIGSRYDGEEIGIVTHDQINKTGAFAIEHTNEIYDFCKDYKVIAIDEAQFFTPDLYQVVLKLSDGDRRIIISGLDLDYTREPFLTMANLLSIADKVDKLNSICMLCKNNASYSLRIIEQKELMVIGGNDSYLPVCKKCFISQQHQHSNLPHE